MSYSQVDICNLAIAALGGEPIRSLGEDNKRARQCDKFFVPSRDVILTKFDWPFARGFKALNQLDMTGIDVPDGMYRYQIPNDCKVPRDLYPHGSKLYWEIFGDQIQCRLSEEVYLYYTKKIVDSAKFSDSFVHALSLLLAVRIGPALTQDKKLLREIYTQYKTEVREAWETEANMDNNYREADEQPENDSFVNPDSSSSFDPQSSRFIR